MFYIFNDKGHYAEKMTCRPPILPVGYFFVEAADDLGDYLFSDGLTVMSASEPAPSQYHVIDAGMWVLSADGAAAQLAAAKGKPNWKRKDKMPKKLLVLCALSLTACANTPPVKVAAETCPQLLQPPPHLMARQVPKAGSYSENALRNMRDWQKPQTTKPPI